MDRRQMLVQRAREFFGDRLDDVLYLVQKDRQDLRGWQEPAHVRAAVRRAVREEGGGVAQMTEVTVAQDTITDVTQVFFEFGRGAAEPDGGQQRETIGQILERGTSALQKVTRNTFDLTNEETFGLEAILLLYGRPSLLISQGRLASVPPFWNLIEDQREDIEVAQRGVGRIEMFGHPEFDWAGTGFLVSDNILLTTRRFAELFAENKDGRWQFRPGISAWMDYRSGYQHVSNAGFRVRSVFGVHPNYDLALLEVEGPQINGSAPIPLSLAATPPPNLNGRPVYVIGFPVRDARRNESEAVARIFRDVYNVKRVQPGVLRGEDNAFNIRFLRHDCAPLGQNAGAPIIDLETNLVLGLQLTGRYLEQSTAVPLYTLRDDPLFKSANIPFTEGTRQEETQRLVSQVERLARTRAFTEVRNFIENLHQRTFGRFER
ncbi:MAG TPA: serine protease [Gemmataceae bacterium]|nr:serine protease [Gemmataceae bacterium]